MIERKILIGLITSTEYLKKVKPLWNPMLIESNTARLISNWALTYYDKYQKAPGKDIELIFLKKLQEGLDEETAEEIEEDILPELSEEYVQEGLDVGLLFDETVHYLQSQQLLTLSSNLENLVENGKGPLEERLKEAQQLTTDFKIISNNRDIGLDLGSDKALEAIDKAFSEAQEPLIRWPKQLGVFWNSQFVRGGFISFLAPEKRGKTFWLLEFAMRAVRQGKKVAFFQAGDMNEAEQLKRIGIYLCKRSNLERYCKEHYEPVRDCIRNQMDTCDKKERECDFGVFTDIDIHEIKKIPQDILIETYETSEYYKPCYNCKDYDIHKLGTAWLKKNTSIYPLDANMAKKAVLKFLRQKESQFLLDTYANGTLSVNTIEQVLDGWEAEKNFVPDIILIDYADLLVPSIKSEFRHQQNQIWKDLRRLSQTHRNNRLPLVISPTQADAGSYKKYRLELGNYSEDKRKYAHVTAMYGLNQDPEGREKSIGLMRINELIIREGEFLNTNEITVLQNLRQGRPFKGSFF